MKNKIIFRLKNKLKLKIEGKNINRFIIRLNNNNIEILNIKHIDKDKTIITVYYNDYKQIQKLKTIYNIEILDYKGLIKIKKKLNVNKYLIISIILGLILLKTLTQIIFKIEIIHNEQEIRELIKNELKIHGIKEKTFKKSYKQINKIKEDILNKYKDKIEWLEIENIGTKYIVRIEERKIEEAKQQNQNRNIIAKKDAIIKEIKSTKGQIIKEVNNYVKKGDIIISGNITSEETIKNQVSAEGKVYGETWYQINVTYPYVYNETKLTNNKKTVYTVKILNKNIELFNFKPFKNKQIEEKVIIKNNIIPFSLTKQIQTEQEYIEEILTEEEAITKALDKGKKTLEQQLKEDEYIINYKILNTKIKENELELNIFYSVYENITDYQTLTKENIE